MNVHEYQAKALLSRYNVPTLKGYYVTSTTEAVTAASKLSNPVKVVKAQIHAGGRGAGHFSGAEGKGGGVRLARSLEEVEKHAKAMLGQTLVTKQTGQEGKKVLGLYIEDGCEIEKEFYLSMLIDRALNAIVMVVSPMGGMDIEAVAEKEPDKVKKIAIGLSTGIMPYHVRFVARLLGLGKAYQKQLSSLLRGLFQAFCELDTSLVEINPLVITKDETLIALDSKMSFDDNALPRQKDVSALRDDSEQDPTEIEAQENELSYIKLNGTIGCMVNGAGLAMATMDIIKQKGAQPANFLDVGGGATKERISKAFAILCRDGNVKGILINIFGGIMRCDIVAMGIVAAARELKIQDIPIVVRLAGTKVEEGQKIMTESGLPIIPAETLDDAATKVVAAC